MRRADHAYHLLRIVCYVDAAPDDHVDTLEVAVTLHPNSGTRQPQIFSMLPKTSRDDTRVKRTVRFGADLKLVAVSHEKEINASHARASIVARGELQQTAEWRLNRAAHLDEEKQFVLVVERPANVRAAAYVRLSATVLCSGEHTVFNARYPLPLVLEA